MFESYVVPKLNGNDVKFFYDVNTESRAAIKRAGVQLRNAFKIGDFNAKSTISWALEKVLTGGNDFVHEWLGMET